MGTEVCFFEGESGGWEREVGHSSPSSDKAESAGALPPLPVGVHGVVIEATGNYL
jgi:hypothetical protein